MERGPTQPVTPYDGTAQKRNDDECRVWIRRVIDYKTEIVAFVAERLNAIHGGHFVEWLTGSFNVCLRTSLDEGHQDVVIRFPRPGLSVCWAEKVTNEVRTIEYLSQNTSIPVPRIRSWGLAEDSPRQLGPVLKQPTDNEEDDQILNPNIDDGKLNLIYEQLADYVLQLSRLSFDRIGAITKDESSGAWSVTRRPFTYDMNELVTSTGYPLDKFPSAPFDSAKEYFRSVADQHLLHLRTQRNIAEDENDAQRRFIARQKYFHIISRYSIEDSGPFRLFCDDFRPANMLIDTETMRITAVFDWEFTNAMPAQYAYDPPWWLLLLWPESWLGRYGLQDFLTQYKPRLQQFLQALEKVEEAHAATRGIVEETPLSARMREAWESDRFWFNIAMRKSLDVDTVYDMVFRKDNGGLESLDDAVRAEIEPFTKLKMKQLEEYYEERDEQMLQEIEQNNAKTETSSSQ